MKKDEIILTYINYFCGDKPVIDIWGKNCNNAQLSRMRKDYPSLDIKRCKLSKFNLQIAI